VVASLADGLPTAELTMLLPALLLHYPLAALQEGFPNLLLPIQIKNIHKCIQ
jgi:hypothetical protein